MLRCSLNSNPQSVIRYQQFALWVKMSNRVSLTKASNYGADQSCVDPENFVRGGPTLTVFFFSFFLVDEGWVDSNSTISRPSLARQRNAISDDVPTLNAGS